MDEEMDEDVIVKVVDCSNQSEVDIELKQFIKGYSDGSKGGDDHLLMLKLKEWPRPIVLEAFLLCQRPEFIVNFPLVDFIHPRWGLLNLAAKLPPDALQPELGMKLLIAHGSHQELGKGDSMTNLMINMCDVVHMLMHATEVHYQCPKRDLPKLNEYLAVHREECAARCQAVSSVKYPIYDQTVYLNDYHKKMLKDQYVQALQGEVCSVWPERHPLPEHLRRPHHPLSRSAHQGQRHHQDRSGD
uniref:Uncharacterized protein n=1 Tax=Zea mays TaxID=4577 RepID=A0A804QJQ4_MAIZE